MRVQNKSSSLFHRIAQISEIEQDIRLVVVIFGLVGNSLMLLIYSRQKLGKFSLSTYFRCMAICNLTLNSIWITFAVTKNFHIELLQSSNLLCKLIVYVTSLPGPISSWLEVAAGLDRFVTIIYPGRFDFVRKIWFRRLVVALIVAFNLAAFFYQLIEYSLINSKKCTTTDDDHDPIMYVDLISECLVPFGFMIFSSCATLFGVIRSRRKASSSDTLANTRRRRDIKFGITMIFSNLFFLLMSTPSRFIVLFPRDLRHPEQVFRSRLYYTITVILYDILHSGGLYLQLIVNGLVRKEIFRFFRSNFF